MTRSITQKSASLLLLPFQMIQALFKIFTTPRLLLPLLVPYLIGAATFITTLWLGVDYRNDLAALIVSPESWWYQILSWLAVVISFFISTLISIVVILLIAETFIEFFLTKAFPLYGFTFPDTPFSLKALTTSTLAALGNDFKRIIMIIILTVITIICSFIPILLFIPPIITAFLAGFDLFNLSLNILEMPFKERRRLIRTHLIEVISLGATLLLFLLIPLGGILFFPAAYLVALKRLSVWEEMQPYKNS
ncbi:MAG: EI24 domain-containing protein [Bdellovibrionota bacterium]|jgi:uncharacterized protein involved in cysteine biosynthesis